MLPSARPHILAAAPGGPGTLGSKGASQGHLEAPASLTSWQAVSSLPFISISG